MQLCYTHMYITLVTKSFARAGKYISRLFDSFSSGIPVFLLDCFACEGEDTGFEAVVEVGGEDDVFVLIAVGKLSVC